MRSFYGTRRGGVREGQVIGMLIWWGLLVAILVVVAGGFLKLKIQQHRYGEEVRLLEGRIRELRTMNLELRARISEATSHAQIMRAREEGRIGLVEVSDQYVARLVVPRVMGGGGERLTAQVQRREEGVKR
ncbi:MAG: hypothetical protein N2035_09330 [Chthoniobacterales bacterium]|nr:hypothetical protein [Chthoniobacterales bacterium]